jgi:GNAT superfamily N-acetyltransferase
MNPIESQYGQFLLSDDTRRLDLSFVYDLLCTPTDTSPGLPTIRFPTVIKNSLCFGVYLGKKQVAFARVVTDYSEFASVWDVFVDEAHRGKGIGKELMRVLMANPKIKGVYRWFLMTSDAHGLYEKQGFKREAFNPYIMMHINEDSSN